MRQHPLGRWGFNEQLFCTMLCIPLDGLPFWVRWSGMVTVRLTRCICADLPDGHGCHTAIEDGGAVGTRGAIRNHAAIGSLTILIHNGLERLVIGLLLNGTVMECCEIILLLALNSQLPNMQGWFRHTHDDARDNDSGEAC